MYSSICHSNVTCPGPKPLCFRPFRQTVNQQRLRNCVKLGPETHSLSQHTIAASDRSLENKASLCRLNKSQNWGQRQKFGSVLNLLDHVVSHADLGPEPRPHHGVVSAEIDEHTCRPDIDIQSRLNPVDIGQTSRGCLVVDPNLVTAAFSLKVEKAYF